LNALKAHHWPGNIRELQNVIERAVILSDGHQELDPQHLGFTASNELDDVSAGIDVPTGTNGNNFATMAEMEKQHVIAALRRCEGNRTHAAKMLNINVRTLRNKLLEYNDVVIDESEKEELSEA
jgi:DNA-binding NtrC family response regulator